MISKVKNILDEIKNKIDTEEEKINELEDRNGNFQSEAEREKTEKVNSPAATSGTISSSLAYV